MFCGSVNDFVRKEAVSSNYFSSINSCFSVRQEHKLIALSEAMRFSSAISRRTLPFHFDRCYFRSLTRCTILVFFGHSEKALPNVVSIALQVCSGK